MMERGENGKRRGRKEGEGREGEENL